jgi:hemin uptake protein HemP
MIDPPATPLRLPRTEPAPADAPPRVIGSEALFGAAREVLIRHGSETYRLRMTRQDKLILTK